MLDDITLEARPGEILSLLGASGGGKTTCLRLIAGFLRGDTGSVRFDDQDVRALPVHKRDVGVVFQSYALFPHLDVARNIAFGLRYRRLQKADIAARVKQALALVRLEGMESRMPAQLSGGQRQRVALARAIAIGPKVLLLDEPLAALDANLRAELQKEIRRVQRESGITTIIVTHDQNEAMAVSDRIAILHNGRVAQYGTPQDLYQRPANAHIARFLGVANLLDVEVQEVSTAGACVVRSGGAGPTWHASALPGSEFKVGERATLAFRENTVSNDVSTSGNRLDIEVQDVVYSGGSWSISGVSAGGPTVRFELPGTQPPPALGQRHQVCWRASDCLLLPGTDA
ncbi:hypothetical protein ASB57_04165 [Bordetella sp. N]|nr:hypothetical protein ASB57_04165 [Bordetella sp. N]